MADPNTNTLLVRLPGATGPRVWSIDLAKDAAPKPIDKAEFPAGLTLGDSKADTPDAPYRLDLSELANTMERWVQQRRATLTGSDASSDAGGGDAQPDGVQAGPHDVVFPVLRGEGDARHVELRLLKNRFSKDDKGLTITPEGVLPVTYAPTEAAMLSLLRSGTILMFLQQTTFPIGVTCYLLNLLALAGIDPDNP